MKDSTKRKIIVKLSNFFGLTVNVKTKHPRYIQLFYTGGSNSILVGNRKILMEKLDCNDWEARRIATTFNPLSWKSCHYGKPFNWEIWARDARYISPYDKETLSPGLTHKFKQLVLSSFPAVEYLKDKRQIVKEQILINQES